MTTKREQAEAAAAEITQRLASKGQVIAGGFAAYLMVTFGDTDAIKALPVSMLADLREAYYSGAQHLFASIMTVLDDDDEPSAEDLRRMDLIHAELEAWGVEAQRRYEARKRQEQERKQ